MTKALINFSILNDGNFLAKAQNIRTSMTGNTDFPDPVPSLGTIGDAIDDYAAALVKAGTGNRSDVADKNAKRKILTDLLRSLAAYVTSIANGDRSKLLTTGFDVSKEKEPVVITKPENITVNNGANSGVLLVSVKRVKGAASYVHEYATPEAMATDSWVSTTTSKSKITFSELEAGKIYYCRIAAVGSKGQIVYSDPIARMVI
jgi:hypothetical protein